MVANLRSPRPSPTRRPGNYEEYHPYGSTAWWAHSTAVSLKRYKYTGMERDEETGLQCHGVRYYAPWLGRWVSADPIGLGDGVNRYRYARNGPIVAVDWNGMLPMDGAATDRLISRELSPEERGLAQGLLAGSLHAGWGMANTAMQFSPLGKIYLAGESGQELDSVVQQQVDALYRGGDKGSPTATAIGAGIGYFGLPLLMPGPVDDLAGGAAAVSAGAPDLAYLGDDFAWTLRPRVDPSKAASTEIDELLKQADTVTVYHKGELRGGEVAGDRYLSTGQDRSAVEALDRPGKVWEFRVPRDVLARWLRESEARYLRDADSVTGVINEELRIEAGTAQEMTQYLVR